MANPRVIKRYANRKMYDTARSCYVTLEEVAEMVRNGEEISVIDNRTKADLTEVTLTQALLDAERRKRGTVPLPGLRDLLSQGGDFLQKRVAEPVTRVREEAQRSVATLRGQAERMLHLKLADDAAKAAGKAPDGSAARVESAAAEQAGAAAEPAHSAWRWPIQAPWNFEEWQHQFDERVRHVMAGFAPRTDAEAADRAELAELRAQVAALQARVAALEAKLADPAK